MRIAGIILLFLFLVSCQDDPVITASLEGQWRGTRAEIRVKPFGLPVPIVKDTDSFDTVIEFREDGVMVIQEGATPKTGTWRRDGDEVEILTDYTIEDIELSGTYNIQTLTESSLELYLTKKRQTIVDPNNAPAVKGRIKITLQFQRL